MNKLEELYNNNIEKIAWVVTKQAVSREHNEFYNRLHNIKKWKNDPNEFNWLVNYYNQNKQSIIRSLAQIGADRSNRLTESELKLKKSKPFLAPLNRINEQSELTFETDQYYPVEYIAELKEQFKRPEPNKNPKRVNGRQRLTNKVITNGLSENLYWKLFDDEKYENEFNIDKINDRMNIIPSSARNLNKYLFGGLSGFNYYEHYKPKQGTNLYDKTKGKKFVGPPGTWMFDLMYFSDYNIKKNRQVATYLVGININTRYAVIRRVNGKKSIDLILAFQDLLKNEPAIHDRLKLLIFDGEKAISSKVFEDFCKEHNINVRITYPGIHTQTAPIDRLCRTLRDYYTKAYMINDQKTRTSINLMNKTRNILQQEKYKTDIQKRSLEVRELFNGEDRFQITPIPTQYLVVKVKHTNELLFPLITKPSDKDAFKNKIYTIIDERDELYDVVEYYNNKKHHGLTKILNKASEIFNVRFKVPSKYLMDDKEGDITPKYVHENEGLELLVIKYCRLYNEYIESINNTTYRIGEKVNVYDCFRSDRGKLIRNNPQFLIGDWEIVSKDGEIYGVYNNDNKQLLHVSKWMLSKL